MTITYEKTHQGETPLGSQVAIITWTFTANGSGDASENTEKVMGIIKRVTTIPDDTDASWNLVIQDEDEVDVLAGAGANRDSGGTKAKEQITPSSPPAVSSQLKPIADSTGGGKKAKVKVYVV